MAYTYDPSQNIQQGLQQAASGVGNIFTQVIAQQQRDYNLAENAFQNIEALKKNLNIFGQKSITSKANDLLGKTSSAIMKNGKLDYSALGEIRQQVAEIGDLKQGYDVGAKEYERMLQLGVANKDNLVSFEKFYKDLSAKMGDENLVKNPQDLQKALADSYTSNLDSFKMFGKSYLSSNPYQKISQDIKDPKTGALMRVQGELPAGWTLDAQGNKIPPPPKTMVVNGQTVTMDYADQELARLQATSPEQLVLMRQQAGFAGQNFSDKEIVKASIDKIPMTVQSTQVKSKDEIRAQELGVKAAEFKGANMQTEFDMEMAMKQAQINYYNSRGTAGAATSAPAEYAQGNMYDIDVPTTSGAVAKLSAAPLGKNMKLSIGNQQAIVTDIAKSKSSGDIWAKVLVDKDDNFLLDTSDLTGATQTWRKVKNPEVFRKTINRTIEAGGFAKKDKPYAQALVDGVFGAPSQNLSKLRGTKPATPKPIVPKPAEAVTISISKIKDKFGDIVVNGKKLKDLTEKEQIEWGKENVEGGENASFVK
jgi:hypothetical protein